MKKTKIKSIIQLAFFFFLRKSTVGIISKIQKCYSHELFTSDLFLMKTL